jgi:hypothetical protein
MILHQALGMSISETSGQAMAQEPQQICSVSTTSTAPSPTTSSTPVSPMDDTTSTNDVEMFKANDNSSCNGVSAFENQSTSGAGQGRWLYASYRHTYILK